MKINRFLTILALLILLAFLLTACGGGNASLSGGSATSNPSQNYDTGVSTGGNVTVVNDSSGAGYYTDGKIVTPENAIPSERRIIRNAQLEITAQDASGLYSRIVRFSFGLGGYEDSYSVTNYETFSVIHAVFKVPPESLNAFVDYVGEEGTIVNSSMQSQDITESYFDAETRLGTKRRSLDQYYQLLKNASGVDEIVTLQKTIDKITEDIESLEGKLRVWNSQVDMSTVSLLIRQNNDPIQIRKEIHWNTLSVEDMTYLIKQGFVSVTNSFMSVLQWLLIVLIGYSPVWILIAIGLYVWIRRKKAALNKTAEETKQKDESE